MKIKVNRVLSQGSFRINFEVSDFTSDEYAKMASFGIPMISMRLSHGGASTVTAIPINQITKSIEASFSSQEAAKQYEDQVLTQLRNSMIRLRDLKDDFSSSQEVVL